MRIAPIMIVVSTLMFSGAHSQQRMAFPKAVARIDTRDTLFIGFAAKEGKLTLAAPDSFIVVLPDRAKNGDWDTRLPWIVATLISALTLLVNIRLNANHRRTTIETVKTQVQASERLALLQHQSTIASKNRQDWIDTLRNCVSEYLANLAGYNMKISSIPKNKRSSASIEKWDETKRILFNGFKLKLLLNTSGENPEDKHVDLERRLNESLDYAVRNYTKFNADAYTAIVKKIEALAQAIIKEEWDRISKPQI